MGSRRRRVPIEPRCRRPRPPGEASSRRGDRQNPRYHPSPKLGTRRHELRRNWALQEWLAEAGLPLHPHAFPTPKSAISGFRESPPGLENHEHLGLLESCEVASPDGATTDQRQHTLPGGARSSSFHAIVNLSVVFFHLLYESVGLKAAQRRRGPRSGHCIEPVVGSHRRPPWSTRRW